MTWLQAGETAAIGTAVLWTFSALAWTAAGKTVGSLSVNFLRLVMTSGLLMAYGQIVRGLCLPTDAAAGTWLALGVSGVLGFLISDLCLVKAFLLIGPRRSLLIQTLTPPLAAIISWLTLNDPLAPRHWLAMGVTLAGIAWVISERPESTDPGCPPENLKRGLVLGLIASAAQAGGMVLSKRGLGDYDPVAATFIRVLVAMAGYLVLVTVLGRWKMMWSAARQPRPMTIVFLGSIVGPFLGVALSLIALRECHAGVAATIFSTSPVLILPFAILLHGEKITLRAVVGAVASVLGIALLVL